MLTPLWKNTPDPAMPKGKLALVVGPSGAGKDTLIAGARAQLAGDTNFVFPRREITRPADAGGEDHIPVSRESFAQRRADGAYALAWEAHGLGYGVPAGIAEDLVHGRTVVVNVSRTVIALARTRFPDLQIMNVTAPVRILAERLAARGRESADDVAKRIDRSGAFVIEGAGVVNVANDGGPEQGIERFVNALIG
jgi:phosphonate metabolism protein PhnN/1,5-bisphosphokinase (PRPP-forming)